MSMNGYPASATRGEMREDKEASEQFFTRVHLTSIVFAEEIWFADIAAWGYLALVLLVLTFAVLRIGQVWGWINHCPPLRSKHWR